VGTATQRSVHDEQVIVGFMLGAEAQRDLQFGFGEPLLKR